jgi:hypothetical protein
MKRTLLLIGMLLAYFTPRFGGGLFLAETERPRWVASGHRAVSTTD